MNLQQANYEDMRGIYFDDRRVRRAWDLLLTDLAEGSKRSNLAILLRDHRTEPVYLPKEIADRAAVDRLLSSCGILEIASLTNFIPDFHDTSFAADLLKILEHRNLRKYYEEFYPTKLPQLLRARLNSTRQLTEAVADGDQSHHVLAFLELDRRFVETLEDGYLLRMLDDFTIEGYRFDDVVESLEIPKQFAEHLLRAPEERDVLSLALAEFCMLMQFCFDLHKLLESMASTPLLQSAVWNQYSYWFGIIAEELRSGLDRALSRFLKWVPQRDDKEAMRQVQAYVASAQSTLEKLTSDAFGAPIDALAKSIARTSGSRRTLG